MEGEMEGAVGGAMEGAMERAVGGTVEGRERGRSHLQARVVLAPAVFGLEEATRDKQEHEGCLYDVLLWRKEGDG